MRLVVVIFGPPGAGKTTAAHQIAAMHGLTVFDRDDERWTSEAAFGRALAAIGNSPTARAVVIRSGATSTARARTARITRATSGWLLDPGMDECLRRVRRRRHTDPAHGVQAVGSWYRAYDRFDAIPDYAGPGSVIGPCRWEPAALTRRGVPARDKAKHYGTSHRAARRAWATQLPLPCTVCGQIVEATDRWDLDHTDDGLGYLGPAHAQCNRSKGAKKRNATRTNITPAPRRLNI